MLLAHTSGMQQPMPIKAEECYEPEDTAWAQFRRGNEGDQPPPGVEFQTSGRPGIMIGGAEGVTSRFRTTRRNQEDRAMSDAVQVPPASLLRFGPPPRRYTFVRSVFVAGYSVAGPFVPRFFVAEPSVAYPFVAGPFVAGPSVAGPSVAGPFAAGPFVAGPSFHLLYGHLLCACCSAKDRCRGHSVIQKPCV